MKAINKIILPYQENNFFSPIREKKDYVRVLMHAARQLLLRIDNKSQAVCKMKLVVDKMSRVFFYKGNKYFSISFPFLVVLDEDNILELTTYSGRKLDNESISAVLTIINSEYFNLHPSLIDFYIEPNGIESAGLFLLEEIFLAEPSYVRFDNDPDNINGKIHPLNHLDVNYSSYGTYKLGLNEIITQAYFENLQNIRTDCSFVID